MNELHWDWYGIVSLQLLETASFCGEAFTLSGVDIQ